jgi:S-adenosylmethionine:tRNA-ribosyltransferase-isomerase (queuine synthetase)
VQISDFDYDLPEELIAQAPLAQRDASLCWSSTAAKDFS